MATRYTDKKIYNDYGNGYIDGRRFVSEVDYVAVDNRKSAEITQLRAELTESRGKAVDFARLVKSIHCCRLCDNFDEPVDSSSCFDCCDNSNFVPSSEVKTAAEVVSDWGGE